MRPSLSAISGAWEHATHCARGSRRVASFRCSERRELSSVMDAVQQQAWCRQWLSVAYRQQIRGQWDCKWPVMLSDLALLVVGGRREGVFGGRKRVKCGQYVPSIPNSLPCVVSCTIPTGHKLNMVPSQQHISTFSSKLVLEAPAGLRANVGAISSYHYKNAADTTSWEACTRW